MANLRVVKRARTVVSGERPGIFSEGCPGYDRHVWDETGGGVRLITGDEPDGQASSTGGSGSGSRKQKPYLNQLPSPDSQ